MRPPDIPGWQLGDELGRGGFATVWEGRRGDERAAIKVSRLGTAAARLRFAREAEAMRRVRAPAAPALFDAGEQAGLPYLVMERIGGETLAALLASRTSPPSLPWVRAIASAMVARIAAVHRAGLVHADIKPGNLRVDPAGPDVRLLDFGLAVPPGAGGVIGGTPRYAAPEQIRGETVAPATDVYGFGLILYEMLAGRSP
ncbi:MAG TPA: serine/threonine-protein kinase, partial [Candidatus Acidoferrum sp.]|nr:serine/threonine-protein kinase [Candidatus Acidoferrum sp.]